VCAMVGRGGRREHRPKGNEDGAPIVALGDERVGRAAAAANACSAGGGTEYSGGSRRLGSVIGEASSCVRRQRHDRLSLSVASTIPTPVSAAGPTPGVDRAKWAASDD